MSEQPDGNEPIRVEVTDAHIERAIPSSADNCAMALALRDAGFDKVTVARSFMILDEVYYQFDEDLSKWQDDAIGGKGMNPMAMQLDFERRSARVLKTLP